MSYNFENFVNIFVNIVERSKMSTSLLSHYFQNRHTVPSLPERTITASWESPSNIAFIKYWGKKEGQLPLNPSLSMTLDKAVSRTKVTARFINGYKGIQAINSDPTHPFIGKLSKLLQKVEEEVPFLDRISFLIDTENTFPHSTGIASSASGISAFSLCLLSILENISGISIPERERKNVVSQVSRWGSGSACRSIYGGFTIWGEVANLPGSTDEYAIPINDVIHASLSDLQDAILVVSGKPKDVSSSAGHSLMNNHPYASGRLLQVKDHFTKAVTALSTGDFERLGEVSESEAISLHALIMTSHGNPILFQPGTIGIMKKVQQLRQSGYPVFFTIDAGANVHLIYPGKEKDSILAVIQSELLPFCENGKIIYDGCGRGPVQLA